MALHLLSGVLLQALACSVSMHSAEYAGIRRIARQTSGLAVLASYTNPVVFNFCCGPSTGPMTFPDLMFGDGWDIARQVVTAGSGQAFAQKLNSCPNVWFPSLLFFFGPSILEECCRNVCMILLRCCFLFANKGYGRDMEP